MLVGACGGVALPLLAQRLRRSRPGTGGEGSTEFASREAYFRWRAHSPRVCFAQGGGGNTLLYQGSRGALAVDAKSFGLGRTLAREGLLFGVSVTHLAMTHHHVDHCGGSEAFGNAVRLAHRNAEPRILATAAASLEGGAAALSALEGRLVDSGVSGSVVSEVRELSDGLQELTPRDFGPTRTFDVEEVIDLGDAPVLVRWVSPGHTDGDLYVHLPDENVLHCGDLLFHGRHPYVDAAAWRTSWGRDAATAAAGRKSRPWGRASSRIWTGASSSCPGISGSSTTKWRGRLPAIAEAWSDRGLRGVPTRRTPTAPAGSAPSA